MCVRVCARKYHHFLPSEFFTIGLNGVFVCLFVCYWNLNESMYPQVSSILPGILTHNKKADNWMFTILLISYSPRFFFRASTSVSRKPITIGIIVMFKFYSFFSSQASLKYFSILSLVIITSLPVSLLTPILTDGQSR